MLKVKLDPRIINAQISGVSLAASDSIYLLCRKYTFLEYNCMRVKADPKNHNLCCYFRHNPIVALGSINSCKRPGTDPNTNKINAPTFITLFATWLLRPYIRVCAHRLRI